MSRHINHWCSQCERWFMEALDDGRDEAITRWVQRILADTRETDMHAPTPDNKGGADNG